MSAIDLVRSVVLNEQELWRDMVRWSGGLVHEQDGLLFVAGPSSYLRVTIRTDAGVDGVSTVRRSEDFFGAFEGGHIVLVREPEDSDVARAALAAAYTPAWTERPMALHEPPRPSSLGADVDVQVVSTPKQVLDCGKVVAEANDDPGELERAGLLFHDRTILVHAVTRERLPGLGRLDRAELRPHVWRPRRQLQIESFPHHGPSMLRAAQDRSGSTGDR
jgi:hypothetical protein